MVGGFFMAWLNPQNRQRRVSTSEPQKLATAQPKKIATAEPQKL